MKLFLFIFLLFSSVANTKQKLTCPIDTIGGERKKVAHFFPLNKNDKLVVCASADSFENEKLKSRFLTEYSAYFFRKDESVSRVFGGSGTTPVRFEQRKKKIYEIVHLNLDGNYFELFKNQIACENLYCKRKEKICVFDQTKMPLPTSQQLESEYSVFAKAKANKQEITQAELAQMSVLAFSGRKLAIEFFTQMEQTPIVLGQAKAFYEQMKNLLNQMTLDGCLKVEEKSSSS